MFNVVHMNASRSYSAVVRASSSSTVTSNLFITEWEGSWATVWSLNLQTGAITVLTWSIFTSYLFSSTILVCLEAETYWLWLWKKVIDSKARSFANLRIGSSLFWSLRVTAFSDCLTGVSIVRLAKSTFGLCEATVMESSLLSFVVGHSDWLSSQASTLSSCHAPLLTLPTRLLVSSVMAKFLWFVKTVHFSFAKPVSWVMAVLL